MLQFQKNVKLETMLKVRMVVSRPMDGSGDARFSDEGIFLSTRDEAETANGTSTTDGSGVGRISGEGKTRDKADIADGTWSTDGSGVGKISGEGKTRDEAEIADGAWSTDGSGIGRISDEGTTLLDAQLTTTLDLIIRLSLVAAANIVAVLDRIGTCLGSAGLTFWVTQQ